MSYYLSVFLSFFIPIALIATFALSIFLYCHAKHKNKKSPGTYTEDQIRNRKVFLIVFAGIFGLAALVVISFTALLYMAVAFM